jgi:hypothetical protein
MHVSLQIGTVTSGLIAADPVVCLQVQNNFDWRSSFVQSSEDSRRGFGHRVEPHVTYTPPLHHAPPFPYILLVTSD